MIGTENGSAELINRLVTLLLPKTVACLASGHIQNDFAFARSIFEVLMSRSFQLAWAEFASVFDLVEENS